MSHDDAKRNFQLGLSYDYAKDYKKAFEYYKLSADTGHPDAQNSVAVCYSCGYGVPQDLQRAIRYYELSANQGNSMAQNTLGLYYGIGKGVDVDLKKSVAYYQQSAEQGNKRAQNNLGICYRYGRGVPQDYEEAAEYYKLSMAQGDAEARFNLALCYEDMEEYKKAIELFTLCDDQKHIKTCEKKLVKEFDILLHINDILYMYPLCVTHKHRDTDILKLILTRKYTKCIPLVSDLTKLTISYLI